MLTQKIDYHDRAQFFPQSVHFTQLQNANQRIPTCFGVFITKIPAWRVPVSVLGAAFQSLGPTPAIKVQAEWLQFADNI